MTVGSMLPFDRLVTAMDQWAQQHPAASVFAQIGEGGRPPRHVEYLEMIDPTAFRQRCRECDVIVSHLGTGTLLMAAEVQRPLVALPRRHDLREVNSDHQLAAATWLQGRPGVEIVESEAGLGAAIERMTGRAGPRDFESATQAALCAVVAGFLREAAGPR